MKELKNLGWCLQKDVYVLGRGLEYYNEEFYTLEIYNNQFLVSKVLDGLGSIEIFRANNLDNMKIQMLRYGL